MEYKLEDFLIEESFLLISEIVIELVAVLPERQPTKNMKKPTRKITANTNRLIISLYN
jgi:hypothetical protein